MGIFHCPTQGKTNSERNLFPILLSTTTVVSTIVTIIAIIASAAPLPNLLFPPCHCHHQHYFTAIGVIVSSLSLLVIPPKLLTFVVATTNVPFSISTIKPLYRFVTVSGSTPPPPLSLPTPLFLLFPPPYQQPTCLFLLSAVLFRVALEN